MTHRSGWGSRSWGFSNPPARQIIRISVKTRRSVERDFNFTRLSRLAKVQNTYLSKALRGQADLSADQLYAIAEILKFSEPERNYLLQLLEHARCDHRKRKQELAARIEATRNQHLRSETHLKARAVRISTEGIQEYCLDPLHQIVHVCLSIKRFQRDPALLAEVLRVRTARITSTIQTLERIGVLVREGQGFRSLVSNIHLPKDSPVYVPWRNQLWSLALQRRQDATSEQAYSFSVVFSANAEVRERLQFLFLDYLKRVEELVKSAPSEEAYQMNFDLLPWSLD